MGRRSSRYTALAVACALACLAPAIALAQQSITTIDMGDGLYISTDQSGRQATTIDLGGGISTTTTSPGFGQPTFPQPALPPLPPIYVPQPTYNPYR
jgi:hypothetical protein